MIAFFSEFLNKKKHFITIYKNPDKTQTNYLYTEHALKMVECYHSIGPHVDAVGTERWAHNR